MTEKNTLSPREEEILKLTAKGLTNREIAQALSISPNTVKVHLSNIFEKTGAASRTEAVLFGMERGILEVPGGGVATEVEGETFFGTIRKYRWIGLAVLVLVLLLGVTFTANVLFPPPEPEAADIEERWQQLAPMPQPRRDMAVVAYDGNIYTAGGEGPDGVSGDVFRYLLEEDRWEALSGKPTPVTEVQAALIGERIYLPGGKLSNGQPTSVLEIYDPRSDSWETGAPLPRSISAYALAAFEGQLYLFGGWDGTQVLSQIYIYDPVEDAWQVGSPMTAARRDASAVALTDKIALTGGRNDRNLFADTLVYFPSRDRRGENPWGNLPDLPEPRHSFGLASIYDSLYVIGGETTRYGSIKHSGIFLTSDGWVSLPTNQEYSDRPIELVSLGSLLVIFDPSPSLQKTSLWQYQAFYYSIYIPFVP